LTTLDLHAAGWCDTLDFYEALLAGLGAPDWHGRNLNALYDSVVVGNINRVERPFCLRVHELNTENVKLMRGIDETVRELGGELLGMTIDDHRLITIKFDK
jgi:RNAse (barnase) inhibitor barstar